MAEVEEALLTGQGLEQYEDTGRGSSCLVVGFTANSKPLHVGCGKIADHGVLMTVYIPTPPKFKNPYERGT